MNDDIISRQAAIDMFNRLADDPWNANANTTWSKAYGYAAEMIDEMPSAQQWIPVSERLPKDEGWYVVTDDSGGVRWLDVEHYDPESGLKPFCTVQNPVAWMPLPEPWKGEEK